MIYKLQKGKIIQAIGKAVKESYTAPKTVSKGWDAAYNAALKSGDTAELQRLRDAHFIFKAPDNKINIPLYHFSDSQFTFFDPKKIGVNDPGFYGKGIYSSPDRAYASTYGPIEYKLYSYSRYPFETLNNEDRSAAAFSFNRLNESPMIDIDKLGFKDELQNADAVYQQGVSFARDDKPIWEVVIPESNHLKLADPITYDDAGNIILLSKRDDFTNPDIRYGWAIPLTFLGAGLSLSQIPSNKNGGIIKAQKGIGKLVEKSLTKAERLGIPKGERKYVLNYQKYLNERGFALPRKHLQGDDAVQMFKEYGTQYPSIENTPLIQQLRKYVPEARERYGLIGNTNITDNEIAGSLYKKVLDLGEDTVARNEVGEPLVLFRGSTKRNLQLYPKGTGEQLVSGTDNILGNLFLGELPGTRKGEGLERYLGVIRDSKYGTEVVPPDTKAAAFTPKWAPEVKEYFPQSRITYNPVEDNLQYLYEWEHPLDGKTKVYKVPAEDMEFGANDINGYVVRTPKVRDATEEISVLTNLSIPKEKQLGETLPLHYRKLIEQAEKEGQGLLVSYPRFKIEPGDRWNKFKDQVVPMFRDEHENFTYYALPNFNILGAKHILPFDLRMPTQWGSRIIYRKNGGILKAQNAARTIPKVIKAIYKTPTVKKLVIPQVPRLDQSLRINSDLTSLQDKIFKEAVLKYGDPVSGSIGESPIGGTKLLSAMMNGTYVEPPANTYGGLRLNPNYYYRRGWGIIDDALDKGIIRVPEGDYIGEALQKYPWLDNGNPFNTTLMGQKFPYFAEGKFWPAGGKLGVEPTDLIAIPKGLPWVKWVAGSKWGALLPDRKPSEFGGRATPLIDGKTNLFPTKYSLLYRLNPETKEYIKLKKGGILKGQGGTKIISTLAKSLKAPKVSQLDHLPIWKRIVPIMKTTQGDLEAMNKYHVLNVNEYNKTFGTNIQSIPFRTDFGSASVKLMPDNEFITRVKEGRHNNPTEDALQVGGFYDTIDDQVVLPYKAKSSVAYHEFLHQGKYGITNPEITKWRISQLVNPDKISELTDNQKNYFLSETEAPVHLRQWGENMGIKVGDPYPGDEAFDALIETNGIGGSAYYMKRDTSDEKKLLWKAMNGTLFGLPIIATSIKEKID